MGRPDWMLTRKEFEELIEEREQTLREWFDRSLVETSTFDQESRGKIMEVVDESEELFGAEEDIQEFVERTLRLLEGELHRQGPSTFASPCPTLLAIG